MGRRRDGLWVLVLAGAFAGCPCTLQPLEPYVPVEDGGDGGADCAGDAGEACGDGGDGGTACPACDARRADHCDGGECLCGASPECNPGDQCLGGACCPAARACGAVCCGASESCLQGVCCPTASLMPQVQSFFTAKCAGCHSGSVSPDLRSGVSRAAMVGQSATGLCGPPYSNGTSWKLVVPGDLGNSVLMRYAIPCACGTSCLNPPCSVGLRCGSGDPICAGKSKAPTAAEQATVQCWILQGAPP